MIKIAVLGYKPLYLRSSGYEKPLANIPMMLNSKDVEIHFFSFGPDNKRVREGSYVEDVIKAPKYAEEGFGLPRLLDFATLMITGDRATLRVMNKSREMLYRLLDYSPDVIIHGDFLISSLIERYNKLARKKACIISFTDGPWQIEASFNAIYQAINERGLSYHILKYPLEVFRRRYMNNANYRYKKMISTSDMLITTTKEDREIIRKISPRKKIYVIPPFFINKQKKVPNRKVHAVKRIAFIGAYQFWPNREAATLIEEKIAPKMRDKRFIIAGSGCPVLKKGNVEYVGRVDDIRKFLQGVDVCIAPLYYGLGLKNKMMDYFISGKAVIGTRYAFAGYAVKNRTNALVEDNIDKFAERILELDCNKKLLQRLQKNSYGLTEGFSEDEMKKKWQSVINSIRKV